MTTESFFVKNGSKGVHQEGHHQPMCQNARTATNWDTISQDARKIPFVATVTKRAILPGAARKLRSAMHASSRDTSWRTAQNAKNGRESSGRSWTLSREPANQWHAAIPHGRDPDLLAGTGRTMRTDTGPPSPQSNKMPAIRPNRRPSKT